MTGNMKFKIRYGLDQLVASARTIQERLGTCDELDLAELNAAVAKVNQLQKIVELAKELAKIEPIPGCAARADAARRARRRSRPGPAPCPSGPPVLRVIEGGR